MTTPQLLEYVSAQLKTGMAKDAITKALIGQGWTQDDVNEAFALMPKPAAPISMPATAPATFSQSSIAAQPRIINQLERQFTPPMQQPTFTPQQQSPIPRQFTASPMSATPMASPMMTPTDAQRKALMHQKAPQSHVLFDLLILLLGILMGAAGVFAYYSLLK